MRGKRSVRAEVDTNKNHVFRGFKGSAGDPLLISVIPRSSKEYQAACMENQAAFMEYQETGLFFELFFPNNVFRTEGF